MNDYPTKSCSLLIDPRLVIVSGIFLVLTIVSLLATHAQTSCTTYYQCAAIQQVSEHKVTGSITYWFDNDHIEGASFLNATDADNFRTRVRAAATDWATKTGISITEGSAGSKVRIRVSGASLYTAANGVVDDDQSNPGKMVMTFSTEWPHWTTEGKDRLASHEWGHIIGFTDVADTGCSGVETIMRQFSSNPSIAEQQLRGTETLPSPGRPNACDVCAAKDKQAGAELGTSCATPSPSPSPSPTPTPNEEETCYSNFGFWFNNTCNWSASPGCEPGQWGFTNSHHTCQYWYTNCECLTDSPIVIDTEGDGFALTNAANGVYFDISGSGIQKRLAWTAAGSDEVWLVLDRNGNGMIDDGTEMFGNYTNQPEPPSGEKRNGFLALAEFDKPANGGNNDGKIKQSDSIFTSLRLWKDSNHNGVSESGELFRLPALGLRTIQLDYQTKKRIDEFGNGFRYRAKVKDHRDAQLGRWAWDVFLVSQP